MNKITYSLNLATYLVANGVEVKPIYSNASNKTYFLFADNDLTRELAYDYRNDTKLHEYLECFKTLRNEMKANKINSVPFN